MTRDRIRRIYRDKGQGGVWNFCANKDLGPCKKAKRFGTGADVWRIKRNQHKKGSAEWKKWEYAREVYHGRAVYHSKRCQDRQNQPNQPATGCGGCGAPNWGGGQSVLEREAVPTLNNYGAWISSRKRTSTLGNPSSDHYVGNVCAYAVDAATTSGADDAHAVARKLGIGGFSTGNYNSYYISRCGKRFRIQILWAVSGHWDHVHVGCRLI
jgi:hypothetical protein